jgi:two-component system phosphate regulon sensor histidine kinase PhoR
MTVPFSSAELKQRIRWYIKVRWCYLVAIAVPALIALIIQHGIDHQVLLDIKIASGALLLNGVMVIASHLRIRREKFFEVLAMGQIVFDIVLMTGVFFFNGGLESPIAMLYCIPILMAGALLGPQAVYTTGVSATTIFVILTTLDFANVLKPDNIVAPQLHDNPNNLFPSMITTAAVMLTITVIADFVGHLVRQRSLLALELESVNIEKAKIEAIIKTMGNGLVATDPAGVITLVNDNFEYLTGWQRHEAVGHQLDDILPMLDENGKRVPPADRPSLHISDLESTNGRVRSVTHYSYVRKDGTTFPFTSHIAPIVFKRQIIGLTNVFDDVTASQKLDQLKTNFVALASHQLKTPIGEIKGYVDNLLYGVGGKLTKKQTEYLGLVRDISEHCTKLVTDLLDITILERGNSTLDLKPVRLSPIIQQLAHIYHDRLAKKGLSLHIVKPAHELTVVADSDKLLEALGNVLANAIAYSKHGDVTIQTEATKDFALISIKDKGKGMDKATVSALFDKDELLSAAPTAEGGTGLGLYLAKHLVGLQNGKISVISTSVKGTTICIKVPLMKG